MKLRIFRRSKRSAASDTQKKPKQPRSPRARRIRRLILATLLIVVIALGVYLKLTFSDYLRRRVVAELESVTGGTVEVQSLTWKLSTLQFDIAGLTVHGRESPNQAPYIHADHLFLKVKFRSLFSNGIRLQYVAVDHPVIHLIVNPDGTTNQPGPRLLSQIGLNPATQLFDLAVDHIDVRNGELLFNEKKLPFQFGADRVSATMKYSAADKIYDGNVSLGLSVAPNKDAKPLDGDVQLHFLLHPTRSEIKSLNVRIGKSSLQATGSVEDYRNLDVRLQYGGSLDLVQIAKAARSPEVQAGRLDLNGAVTYQHGRYTSDGNIAVHDLGWRDSSIHLSGVELSSLFSITPEKFVLSRLMAHALGGYAQGQAQVLNWSLWGPQSKIAPGQGSATLKVAGMQVHQLALAVSTSRLPTDKTNLVGAIAGDVNLTWTGAPSNMVARFVLGVSPPANPTPPQVPLTANLQATYHGRGDYIDVTSLNAATRDMRLNATGNLGSQNTQLKVSFNANNLNELQPALDTLNADAPVAFSVHGRAAFNGMIFGKLRQPSVRGHIDVANFDTVATTTPPRLLPSSSPPQKSVHRMHWDTGAADIVYTPAQLAVQNGIFKRGTAQIAFSGSVTLDRGHFDPNTSQIAGDVRAQNASLADIQALAGLDYPATGIVNGNIHATGTMKDLRGSGSVQVAQVTIYGEPFRLLRADIKLASGDSQFNNIVLSRPGSQVTGSASYSLANGGLHYDLRGTGIDLVSFQRFQPARISVTGKADFHLTGSGTLNAPVINGQIDFHHLIVNGEQAGDLTATAETRGEDLQLRARSNFQNAALTLDGTVRLRDNLQAQITLKFEHLDVDPLIHPYYQGRLTGHSSIAGTIDIRGPLKRLQDLAVTGNIQQLSLEAENVKMQNTGPIRFSVTNKVVHIDQFHLGGEDTDFSIQGTAQLDGARALNLRTDGRMNLKLFQAFNPGMTSSGLATLTMTLEGTVAQPHMSGRMEIANGAISVEGLPNGLSQINGRLAFAQDRVLIEALTAHTGGGAMTLGGFIAYRNGVYFDVTATGKDVRLRYPPGISASADASLRYTGSAQSSLLSGDVTILRFAMSPHFDFAQYLARSKSAVTSSTPNPFLDNMRLDIHVVSAPELRFETSIAKLSGAANLRIRGTVANPGVLGRVNIAEGDIFFNGTKYRLQRGDVSFNNPLVIQPVIDLEMEARVRDYEITIGFHGSFDRLNITYRSDPPLPSGDIVALLAFGRTKEEDIYRSRSAQQIDAPSAVVLDQALSSASTSRVQKIFGVSRIKVDPLAAGPENNPTTRVTIEQQVSNNITVTYLTNLAQSQSQQVIQMEYNINRSVSIVAVRDQNGILGFDVHFRQRKK
jgi:translocation and assembly module TamB